MTTRSLPYTRTGDPPTGPLSARSWRASGAAATAPAGLPGESTIAGRERHENFPVASRLLPSEVRAALMEVYRYSRFVDEIGDSYSGDRLGALDWVDSEIRRGVSGANDVHPLVAGAAGLVRSGRITADPLFELLQANRLDQTVLEYSTFEELLGYCELSANPVGRLVLQVFGVHTPERAAWSDAICTGLQLAEHWQDVAEDARAGRVYLPAEDLRSFAVEVSELSVDGPASASLRSAMAFEVRRARDLLDRGAPLIGSLKGRLRFAVAGFWAGGHSALDALGKADFALNAGTRPAPRRMAWHMARALAAPQRIGQNRAGKNGAGKNGAGRNRAGQSA